MIVLWLLRVDDTVFISQVKKLRFRMIKSSAQVMKEKLNSAQASLTVGRAAGNSSRQHSMNKRKKSGSQLTSGAPDVLSLERSLNLCLLLQVVPTCPDHRS